MKIVLRGMKPPPARTRSTVSGSVGFRRSNNWAVGPSPVLRHHGHGVMQIVGAECGEGSHRARVLGFRTVRTCRREVAKVVGDHERRLHVNRERKKMTVFGLIGIESISSSGAESSADGNARFICTSLYSIAASDRSGRVARFRLTSSRISSDQCTQMTRCVANVNNRSVTSIPYRTFASITATGRSNKTHR